MPYDITKEDYDDKQCVEVWLMTIGNDIPTDYIKNKDDYLIKTCRFKRLIFDKTSSIKVLF